MLGLFQIGDEVTWPDSNNVIHYGDITALTDDNYADVYEHDIEDTVVVPIALLMHQD